MNINTVTLSGFLATDIELKQVFLTLYVSDGGQKLVQTQAKRGIR